jgi:hypothetical protein
MTINKLTLYILEKDTCANALDRETQAKARGRYALCSELLSKIKKG